jgi:tRNA G18 (ribose-2'-O)-methylase SpoU
MLNRMSTVVRVDSLDDPRVAHYRNMKDRDLAQQPGALFIAEGEHVVRRLVASPRFETRSMLLAERRVEEIAPLAPPGATVYVASSDVMHRIVGFKFHSGVLAVGRRRGPAPTLESVVPPGDSPITLVVCPEVANTENLGGLIRVAAAFGGGAMVLGPRSCSPFFRQSIRVAMGTVFSLPIVESQDLLRDLAWLRSERGVRSIATVLDDSAEPLAQAARDPRIALVFGNEAQGLDDSIVRACDRRVTIPMKLGTDSLNVAVAAGVCLYHFTR